jgi:Zn-dependent M28 family amino/carboxypeptidase
VADRLSGNFKSLGYAVDEQLYYYKGEIYYNICAFPESERTKQDSRPLLVVGAHYDTVSHSPGADDNASGIAGIMELARLISKDPPPGIRLVAFALEEPPVFRTRHMGSFVFARRLKKSRAKVRGMICLDMIGYFSDRPQSQSFPLYFMDRFYPNAGNFIALVGNMKSAKWTKQVKQVFSRGTDLPVESLNAPMIVVGIDFSDHRSFNHFGYPALLITDTAFYRNRNYHSPFDVPKTLDFQRSAKVVDGLVHAVKNLA